MVAVTKIAFEHNFLCKESGLNLNHLAIASILF